MIRFILLLIALVFFISIVVALLFMTLVVLAMAALVGIPLWYMSRRWTHGRGIGGKARSPIDRLRALYVEDKIDLFEFERRVAQLISIEH